MLRWLLKFCCEWPLLGGDGFWCEWPLLDWQCHAGMRWTQPTPRCIQNVWRKPRHVFNKWTGSDNCQLQSSLVMTHHTIPQQLLVWYNTWMPNSLRLTHDVWTFFSPEVSCMGLIVFLVLAYHSEGHKRSCWICITCKLQVLKEFSRTLSLDLTTCKILYWGPTFSKLSQQLQPISSGRQAIVWGLLCYRSGITHWCLVGFL